MRPLMVFVFSLLLSSGLAVAQEQENTQFLTPQDKGQASYVLRRLPMGLASMPSEAIYRLTRTLKINRWDQMIDKPEVRAVLNQTKELRSPVNGSTFPFENFASDFEGIVDRDFGVCSGFATLQRNFNILMHFDPKNKHQAVVPDIKKNIVAYYNYYTELIKKAANNNPVIIPHYSNLTEFFSEPYFQVIAKELIVKKWAKNNTSIQGIEQFLKANKTLKMKKWAKLYQDLKERLDAGYNPIIYGSFYPTDEIKYNIHVIQVMKISERRSDGSFEIYIWDDGVLHDHFGEFSPEKLLKVITFRPNGSIWWLESEDYLSLPFNKPNSPEMLKLRDNELIDETLMVGLLPNDDKIMAKMMKRKLKWCLSNPELRKYCQ